MTSEEVTGLCSEAIWVTMKMCAPIMLLAMLVGLIVALFQAMTQVQEMTLTFVPKIIVIFLTLLLTISYMGDALMGLTSQIFNKMVQID